MSSEVNNVAIYLALLYGGGGRKDVLQAVAEQKGYVRRCNDDILHPILLTFQHIQINLYKTTM